jgi:Fur family ferric uptake transcriptional regulator
MDILKEDPGHPDAGKIFEEAKKQDSRISLATVYRTLALLKQAGLIEENSLGEDHGHFETVHNLHHYHFTCLGCGTVVEFETAEIPAVVKALSERENLQVTEIHFHLQGYCQNCQKTTPGQPDGRLSR